MKSIAILIALVATANIVKADTLSDFGGYISQFNIGTCQAFVEDPSNERDTCLVACTSTGTFIVTAFTTADYSTK